VVLKVIPAEGGPSEVGYPRREALAYASGLLATAPGRLRAPRSYGIDETDDGRGYLWL
jgi:hypothetical protein